MVSNDRKEGWARWERKYNRILEDYVFGKLVKIAIGLRD